MKKKLISFYMLTGSLFLITDAYAYIDPGTGSMLLQGLIATIAAGLVVIKLYWQKVKAFLFGQNRKVKSAGEDRPREKDAG